MKAFLLLLGFVAAQASAADMRVAVLDMDAPEAAAAVTATLSKLKGVALVERQELSVVAVERALQQAGSGFLAPAGPEAADGLLLLELSGELIHARLFSTHHGMVVWSAEFPVSAGQLPTRGLKEGLPKLTVAPDALTPVGILAFRSATFSPQGMINEKQLTRMVETLLERQSNTVLLERRALGSVAFERSLRTMNPDLAGSLRLLDGAFDGANNQWTMRLRIRSPLEESERQVLLAAETLAGLAEKISEAIGEPSGGGISRVNEAEEFFREAQRAERAKQDDEALAAAQTAEALGKSGPDLDRLLALQHARRVRLDPRFFGGRYLDSPPLSPAMRWEHAMQALDYADEAKSAGKSLPWDEILGACSEFVAELDREPVSGVDPEPIRARLRQMAPFDPSGKRPPYNFGYAGDFAPTWANSPEELVAFHRTWLTSSHPKRFWLLKRLYGPPGQTLGSRFPDAALKDRLIRELAAELRGDPRHELIGLLLASKIGDPKLSPVARQKYLTRFAERAEELEASGEFDRLVNAERSGTGEFSAERARRLIAVLPKLSQFHNEFFYLEFQNSFAPDEGQKIWSAYADYRRRILRDSPPDKKSDHARLLAFHGSNFLERNSYVSDTPIRNPTAIVVDRFWAIPGAEPGRARYTTKAVAMHDAIWLSCGWTSNNVNAEFWRVSLPSFDAKSLQVSGQVASSQFVVTDEALSAVFGEYPDKDNPLEYSLYRYTFENQKWEIRPLRHVYSIFSIGQELAFCLWNPGGRQEENGLLLYDWATGRERLLASSRRQPPETPLDTIANTRVLFVSQLPDRRLMLIQGHPRWQVLAVDREAGAFETLLSGSKLEAFPQADGLLLAGQLGEIWQYDGQKLELWMSRDSAAKWLTPDDWNFEIVSNHRVASISGHLYFLQRNERGAYSLRVFAQGLLNEGVSIPLNFSMTDSQARTLRDLQADRQPAGGAFWQGGDPANFSVGLKLFATMPGLVFLAHQHGFWFLPFNLIDQAIASSTVNSATLTP